MKKCGLLCILLLITLLLSTLALASCDGGTTVMSISIDEDTIPLEAAAGELDISQIKVLVEKSDGSIKSIFLYEFMLSNKDVAKLSTAGTHTITVTYRGKCDTFTITLHAHTYAYGEWTQTIAPTCTTAGSEKRVCTCGQEETREIPALGHTYGEWSQVLAPTCTTAGSEQRVCSVCGEIDTRKIPALGHTGDSATCTHKAICTVCGIEYGGLARHNYVNGTCTVCGENQPPFLSLSEYWTAKGDMINEMYFQCFSPEIVFIADCNLFDDIAVNDMITSYISIYDIPLIIECTPTADKTTLISALNDMNGEYTYYVDNTTGYVVCDVLGNNIIDVFIYTVEEVGGVYYCNSRTILLRLSDNSITEFTIPSTVTSIGPGAFTYCTFLTSITIPSTVTSIGSYAFYKCTSLTSITIPSTVTSIGPGAFTYCTYLTSITIPSTVTSIGSYAFYK
ncbi:MAG: leucine-rich repeat domain-containing protein, partial [Clostridia bacterium]|nr:leucine-rich repeat domain-containing protein [Clostridia bacterium]